MATEPQTAFFSYSRNDSEFALRLAGDLKAAGANVWLDQLDIAPGQRWARAVQDALNNCQRLLVILSPSSANSTNVEDEVAFALEEHKTVIPVLYRECKVPFQLRPFQRVDFTTDYDRGLKTLLKALGVEQQAVAAGGATVSAVPKESETDLSDADERKGAVEQARLEEERRRAAEKVRLGQEEHDREAAEQARLEEERKREAEQARLEEERKQREEAEAARLAALAEAERKRAAEQARLEQERKQAAEKARLEQERKEAAEQVRLDVERKREAEQARLEEERKQREEAETARLVALAEAERRRAAEQARLELEEGERQDAAEKARLTAEERERQTKARLEEAERQRYATSEKARLEEEEREQLAAAERQRLELQERQRQLTAEEESAREAAGQPAAPAQPEPEVSEPAISRALELSFPEGAPEESSAAAVASKTAVDKHTLPPEPAVEVAAPASPSLEQPPEVLPEVLLGAKRTPASRAWVLVPIFFFGTVVLVVSIAIYETSSHPSTHTSLATRTNSTPPQIQDAAEKGAQGDWNGAAASLNSAPRYGLSRVYLAEALVHLKRPSDAIEQIFENQESDAFPGLYNDSHYVYWPNRRASKAIEQEKLSEALGQCTGAPQLGWFDDDSDALTNCGVVLAYHENASGDDLKQAKSYWQHVLKYPDISHNNKSAAECDLAALLARGDDPKGAIDLYTSYLSVDPNDGTAQMNLGFLLAQRQQYAEAALHFRAATMIRDDDLRSDASGYLRSALRKQAEAYARSGQWTKATNLLQRAIMTSGSTDYTWSEWEKLLVFCALNAGQWKLAEAKAQILIDNLSGDELAGFYYWLGVARMGEGDRSGALTAFRFVQDHYPRDAWLEHTIEIANGH